MAKIVVVVLLLLFAAVRAEALEYTDVYYDAAEPGWGFFLVQSDTTQYIAFFVYGPDGRPTWYAALLIDDGTANYSGPLYATTGTHFALPWAGYGVEVVGTASFAPSDRYHATLTYTLTGAGTVSKPVQRLTLTPYVLVGNYSGSMSGAISGCADPTGNDSSFRGRYGLAVTQVADESATLTFTFVDAVHNGVVCTMSGPLSHLGRLYQLNGRLTCTGPGVDPAPHGVTIDALHPTGQGIEGHLSGSAGGGCTASLHFAAVRNVNR
jgi:hypothetical protein